MKEITFELTNYCEHGCRFCSSDAVTCMQRATFLPYTTFHDILVAGAPYDRVILSGGEPLAHPEFYAILRAAEFHSDDVVVYTNALRHIAFNAHVIDGVRVEANLTVPENVEAIHVLKRVPQGREATRPEVQLSRNWDSESCAQDCDHVVILPDGSRGRPCKKRDA